MILKRYDLEKANRPSYFILLILGIGLSIVAPRTVDAQGDAASKYRNNVVRIVAGDGNSENGFGFLVADANNFLYIVTAYHVVSGSGDPNSTQPAIHVVFFWDQATKYDATLLEHEGKHDLALLRLKEPSQVAWDPKCLASSSEQVHGTKVWFVGRGSDWYVAAVDGAIASQGPDLDQFLDATMPGIQPGSSGAPLFTENGITGMVEALNVADTKVLSVGFIQQAVQGWGYPWSLDLAPVNVQGVWNFKIVNDLPLVFHFGQQGIGTADSPKQNDIGMVLQYTAAGNQIDVHIQIPPPGVDARFVGNIGPSSINGTFIQTGSAPLQIKRVNSAPSVDSSGTVMGDWQGVLDLGLPIVLHLNSDGTGTFDDLRHISFGNALSYTISGTKIDIQMTPATASFSGTVSQRTMTGTYSQNQQDLALTISKQ